MIVPGMLVCSSFLISVCMFIVSKALLISSVTVIVRAGGAIWLNPFYTVLFTVCNAVTLVLCFVPVLRGCVRLCKEECSSPASAITERRVEGYGSVLGVLVYVFVGFWDGDYVSQLPYVWYYVGVKSSFQHAREK